MGPDDIGAERLGYGYAITAHRSQGSTVDVAHVLDDGGGRELAYVAMSRARTASHIYVTAANLRQAAERLTWTWDQQRRQAWITEVPQGGQLSGEAAIVELRGERDRLTGLIPPATMKRSYGAFLIVVGAYFLLGTKTTPVPVKPAAKAAVE